MSDRTPRADSWAARSGRWYGGQSTAVKAVVFVGAILVAITVLSLAINAIGGDGFGGVVLIVVLFVAYFFPSFVAERRGVPNAGSVKVINLFFGWTLIGWVIALAMAMAGTRNGETARRDQNATRWGDRGMVPTRDLRPCPYCAEDIKKAAIVCKHCGRDLPPLPGDQLGVDGG